jgi:hypothetical protein
MIPFIIPDILSSTRSQRENRVCGPRSVIGMFQNFDVALDGKGIAALMLAELPKARQAQSHVIFLENFFDELRRRLPVAAELAICF